jgi:hypothetical protein
MVWGRREVLSGFECVWLSSRFERAWLAMIDSGFADSLGEGDIQGGG